MHRFLHHARLCRVGPTHLQIIYIKGTKIVVTVHTFLLHHHQPSLCLEKLFWCGSNEVYNGCCNTTGESWLLSTDIELHKMHILYTGTACQIRQYRPLWCYAQAGNVGLAIIMPTSLELVRYKESATQEYMPAVDKCKFITLTCYF